MVALDDALMDLPGAALPRVQRDMACNPIRDPMTGRVVRCERGQV